VFSDKPTLTGPRVVLCPFTAADIEAMGPVLADPDVLRLTGSVHTTAETLTAAARLDERTRRWYETRNEQTDRLDLALVDAVTGRCVGEAVLNDTDETNRSSGFRILIGPGGRDRGLGTEATVLLMEHAFTTLGLERVELEVFAFNPRGRRVYEKAGFVVEGVRRGALLFDGERVDAVVMGLLRTDPRPRPDAPG